MYIPLCSSRLVRYIDKWGIGRKYAYLWASRRVCRVHYQDGCYQRFDDPCGEYKLKNENGYSHKILF